MSFLFRCRRLLAVWVLLLSGMPCAAVRVASSDANPVQVDLTIVGGRPAVAWVEASEGTVRYARALDVNGAAWGEPVPVTAAAMVTSPLLPRLALREVNGRPAICGASWGGLWYLRALDAEGTAWPESPQEFFFSRNLLQWKMEVINGRPSVLSINEFIVQFHRALDADGAAWALPVTAAQLTVGDDSPHPLGIDLKEVDGRPAAVFTDRPPGPLPPGVSGGVYFVRASDANGTGWGVPVRLDGPNPDQNVSMQMVDGHPAVAFISADPFLDGFTPAVFKYRRALTPDGASWGEPVTIHPASPFASAPTACPSLALVNGAPALALLTLQRELIFAQANDSTGSTWNQAVPLRGSTGFLEQASLVEVNGRPAVAYIDSVTRSVDYLRADAGADASLALWPPELQVASDDGTILPGTGSLFFNNTAAGDEQILVLTLLNPSPIAADLHLTRILSGEHAAEFKILTFPDAIPGAGAAQLVVAYAPLSPGFKNAELEIVTNAGAGAKLFLLKMSGSTGPDLSVERPGGRVVPRAGTWGLPAVTAGISGDHAFLVRNTGVVDLGVESLEITGPDHAEFSVVQPLPAGLAPGRGATFVIRHTPLTSGPKEATLTIKSNALTPRDIYAFTLQLRSGSVDETFATTGNATGEESFRCVALEPGGRILAGVGNTVAAFRPDGTPDTTWFAPALGGSAIALAVQRDGSILAGGYFGARDGGDVYDGVVRLLPDGTPDTAFHAPTGFPVHSLAILPDGKIMAGGRYLNAPEGASSLVRLSPDGSLDESFRYPSIETVENIAPMPGGRMLVCGFFGDESPMRLLNADGSYAAFNTGLTHSQRTVALRQDGWFLSSIRYGTGILRFQEGTPFQPEFVPTMQDASVVDLVMQADGACLAGGAISVDSRWEWIMGRVAASGSDDTGFFVHTGITITDIALQEDGRPVIAGTLIDVPENGFPPGLMRLNSGPSLSRLTREGSTSVRWMRGGTAPEVSDVTFEINTPGGGDDAWVMLGWGTRITGGWELTGLNLPDTCRLRARGRAGGSLTQAMVSYPAPLEAWRLQHFGTTANTGDAANDADPDKDGLTNFAEYAFDLDPADGSSSALPVFTLTNVGFTAAFTVPKGREAEVIYRAEWSPSMLPGTWTPVPDFGTGSTHAFHAPATGARVFVRWEVSQR